MQDILLTIIQGNEVSKLADKKIDEDKVASYLAEGIMKETVLRILTNEIGRPLVQIADAERQELYRALMGDLESFKVIGHMTRVVAKDAINEQVSKQVLEE
mgnify:CR=1 FL=1